MISLSVRFISPTLADCDMVSTEEPKERRRSRLLTNFSRLPGPWKRISAPPYKKCRILNQKKYTCHILFPTAAAAACNIQSQSASQFPLCSALVSLTCEDVFHCVSSEFKHPNGKKALYPRKTRRKKKRSSSGSLSWLSSRARLEFCGMLPIALTFRHTDTFIHAH